MYDAIIDIYYFNMVYARQLIGDIPDGQMCDQPVPGRVLNHPAFIIGHLAWVSRWRAQKLGLPQVALSDWSKLFSNGNKPLPDRSCYPAKAELLQVLEIAHARLSAAVAKATPEELNEVAIFMTSAETLHLGQLSAWRRAMGLEPRFADNTTIFLSKTLQGLTLSDVELASDTRQIRIQKTISNHPASKKDLTLQYEYIPASDNWTFEPAKGRLTIPPGGDVPLNIAVTIDPDRRLPLPRVVVSIAFSGRPPVVMDVEVYPSLPQ
jgi:hypothetical protein